MLSATLHPSHRSEAEQIFGGKIPDHIGRISGAHVPMMANDIARANYTLRKTRASRREAVKKQLAEELMTKAKRYGYSAPARASVKENRQTFAPVTQVDASVGGPKGQSLMGRLTPLFSAAHRQPSSPFPVLWPFHPAHRNLAGQYAAIFSSFQAFEKLSAEAKESPKDDAGESAGFDDEYTEILGNNPRSDREVARSCSAEAQESHVKVVRAGGSTGVDVDRRGESCIESMQKNVFVVRAPSIDREQFAGNYFFGSFNQYTATRAGMSDWSRAACQSSCTCNALEFLSYALQQDSVCKWVKERSRQGSNGIDEILNEGRSKYEKIHHKMLENQEKLILEDEQINVGNTIHVLEIDKIEETYFVTHVRSSPIQPITPDFVSSEKTSLYFKQLLVDCVRLMTENGHQKNGIIFGCNGATYGISIILNDNMMEISILDSHGSERVWGHNKAFIYSTEDMDDASHFLGSLIRYEDTTANLPDRNLATVSIFKPRYFS